MITIYNLFYILKWDTFVIISTTAGCRCCTRLAVKASRLGSLKLVFLVLSCYLLGSLPFDWTHAVMLRWLSSPFNAVSPILNYGTLLGILFIYTGCDSQNTIIFFTIFKRRMYLYNSSQHCILIITSTFWIPNGVKQKHNHKIPWIYKVPFPHPSKSLQQFSYLFAHLSFQHP